jgi:folate-binding protein YgfZ
MSLESLSLALAPALALRPFGVARLDHLGVIKITGDDNAKFLQGQLTQDFALLGLQEARLAAFCNAKGRMQASFIGFKYQSGDHTDIVLICSKDLLAATMKRLAMFVMRAKAVLTDASAEFAVYGLLGKQDATAALTPWSKKESGSASIVELYPAPGLARQLWVGPATAPPPQGDAIDLNAWLLSEVQSGVATLSTPIFEALVPQMLNYESVGGVNFKKGCYPGQEVVARSQFRGTLKRRAYILTCKQSMAAGALIYSSLDQEQECGLVVQAATDANGLWWAIASMQVQAALEGQLTLAAPAGAALTLHPLPYALLEDI